MNFETSRGTFPDAKKKKKKIDNTLGYQGYGHQKLFFFVSDEGSTAMSRI